MSYNFTWSLQVAGGKDFRFTLQKPGSGLFVQVSTSGPPSHSAASSETLGRLRSKQYNGNDIGVGLGSVRQMPGYGADGTSSIRPRASSCSQRPAAVIPGARPRAAVTATTPAAAAPLLGNIGCGGERSRSQNPLELSKLMKCFDMNDKI